MPWPVPAESTTAERGTARAELGLSAAHEVALYAGNLDAYQGLDTLLPALARVAQRRPMFRWLVATAADTTRLEQRLQAHGLEHRTLFTSLNDEPARRRIHAASDVALVPRAAPGGVPIKLLDACARGLPVVAAERALAGLELTDQCTVITESDSANAWTSAIDEVLADAAGAESRARRARSYIGQQHGPARLIEALTRSHPT